MGGQSLTAQWIPRAVGLSFPSGTFLGENRAVNAPDTAVPATAASVPEAADVPFEVRQSGIEGSGAFATRPLGHEETVAEYVGERLPKAESSRRQQAGNPFIFTVDEEIDIDGDVPWNPARFINHSCMPNCEAVLDEGRIWIVTCREIAAGEELTFNYGYDLSEYHDYPCRCGSPECVGYIVAAEFFPEVRRRNLEQAVPPAPPSSP